MAGRESLNHTGNELALMLEHKKPLSMFYDDADVSDEESVIPEREFDEFVRNGLMIKEEMVFTLQNNPKTGRSCRVKYVLYALANEQWRIPAMFLAIKTMLRIGRADEGIDRMMSALLGYTDEQIDAFVQQRRAAG